MTKRKRDELTQRKALQDAGWKVTKPNKVCFNEGSETDRHFQCKSQVGWFLIQQGYRIDSEVTNDAGTAEADIVAYGNGEPPFVVECETGLNPTIRSKKLDQFYHDAPFCECYLLEVNEMPEERPNQLKWLEEQLGGSL